MRFATFFLLLLRWKRRPAAFGVISFLLLLSPVLISTSQFPPRSDFQFHTLTQSIHTASEWAFPTFRGIPWRFIPTGMRRKKEAERGFFPRVQSQKTLDQKIPTTCTWIFPIVRGISVSLVSSGTPFCTASFWTVCSISYILYVSVCVYVWVTPRRSIFFLSSNGEKKREAFFSPFFFLSFLSADFVVRERGLQRQNDLKSFLHNSQLGSLQRNHSNPTISRNKNCCASRERKKESNNKRRRIFARRTDKESFGTFWYQNLL